MMSDTQLINVLESMGTPGLKWIARGSMSGRGYRLHQVTDVEAAIWGHRCADTPRLAIEKAVAREVETVQARWRFRVSCRPGDHADPCGPVLDSTGCAVDGLCACGCGEGRRCIR